MSRLTTPILRSRPNTSRWAHHHTSLSRESDVKPISPSSRDEENTCESCPKPASPHASYQPSQERPRSPTPEIMLSGWQPVEPSPALWVFLKNAPPPPSTPEYAAPCQVQARARQQSQEQAQVGSLRIDGGGARCDSVVDEEVWARARRNGGEMVRGVDVDLERQGVEEDKAQGIRWVWGRIRGWVFGWLS